MNKEGRFGRQNSTTSSIEYRRANRMTSGEAGTQDMNRGLIVRPRINRGSGQLICQYVKNAKVFRGGVAICEIDEFGQPKSTFINFVFGIGSPLLNNSI
jgi:hypothetical protein